ncbi:pentatricopeptide repeat-containing At1g60770 [Olea europaea subsp. europaea]|uniref:Pentatricopeptide repeat-containing At1g60770 n=1 Tax=Olea europaea subsp. europaea TaxID=158383 RepID=A0A8S0QNM9_OLEEU|nr:pentatricopeptide repeat-containing At1g60770 [Olea europaea subsp. europaea]
MPYNSLMILYTKTGQAENVPAIIQEIKSCDIMPDSYTYNVWMRALASMNEISGVERLIDEMKRDGRVAGDWRTYSNLASVYADAGLFDKAEKALKELEKLNTTREHSAYPFLVTVLRDVTGSGHLELKSALDCIENAILTGREDGGKWTPLPAVIGELMRQFEQNKNVEGAKHFLEVLKKSKASRDQKYLNHR